MGFLMSMVPELLKDKGLIRVVRHVQKKADGERITC